MIATFLLCFIVVDRLLLEQYEQAYRLRLEELIEDLGAQLETMRLPEVDDLMNHFAFENHANIAVTTEIYDPSIFETFTNFDHLPLDILFKQDHAHYLSIGELDESAVEDELFSDEVLLYEEVAEYEYYTRFEVFTDTPPTPPTMFMTEEPSESDDIPDSHRFFIFDPLWNILAGFETIEELSLFIENAEEALDELEQITYIAVDENRELIATTTTISDMVSFMDFKNFETDTNRSFDHLFLFGVEGANIITQTFDFPNLEANVNHQLTIEMSFAPATHIINQLRQMAVPLFVAVTVIAFLIALAFAYYLSRPIVHISQISRKMSDLDLGGRIKIKRRDEIGELAYHLNDMANKLATSMTDLTDTNAKLKIEMAKEKEQEKQRKDFFMAVSHELKTPLMILKTQLSGMIKRIGIYENRDLYLERAQETTDNMTDLVNSLLKITQLNATDMKLELEMTDLTKLVEEVCQNYEDLASDKGVSLTHFCEKDIIVNLDKGQISTALSNIVANAIVHTNKGELVDIQLHRTKDTGILKVENYGAKLNDEDIPHLFEPFYRTDKSRNRYTGGSGMGLYLVKSILDLHGFSYKLKNSTKGVIFEINFPLISSTGLSTTLVNNSLKSTTKT